MELVIDKKLLKVYFDSLTPNKKEEFIHHLILSVESPKNKMKISSKYLDILESYFSNECITQKDFFQKFITSLSDEGRIIGFKSNLDSDEEEDLLEEMMIHEYKDFTFLLTKELEIEKFKTNQSIISRVNKPNLDWLILALSSCSVIQLDYSDFNKSSNLEDIFMFCSNFPLRGKVLHIIDSYFNLNGSSQLKAFKHKGHKIKCYTSSFLKVDSDKSILRNSIKSYFGNKTSVLFSSDKSILHERKLLLEDLVIDSTHDFSEINLRNKNWTLYFIICETKKANIIEKLSKYN